MQKLDTTYKSKIYKESINNLYYHAVKTNLVLKFYLFFSNMERKILKNQCEKGNTWKWKEINFKSLLIFSKKIN